MENFETKESPEKNGTVLYLSYENGYRSVKEYNEQLSEHYARPIELTREEIVDLLTKKSQSFAGKFNPEEITE
jgi:hypothetical protein